MRGLPLAATDGQSVAVEVAGRPTEAKPRAGLQSQNNLGTALWTLGERENGTELLLEAVEAASSR